MPCPLGSKIKTDQDSKEDRHRKSLLVNLRLYRIVTKRFAVFPGPYTPYQ